MAKKKTHQEFVKEVFDLVGEEYEVIGEYINTSEKILIKHNICSYEYQASPNKFLSGRRCPECSKKKGAQKQSKTHEDFIKEVSDLVGDEYEVLSIYVKSKEKVEFKHKVCGTIFKMQPSNFLSGQRCNVCCYKMTAEKQRHTTEKFVSDVYQLVADEYTVLGEYVNNHTHILMRHNECEYEYLVKPSNFKGGKRCPKCQRGVQRSPQMYREEIYELYGEEYTILGDFQAIHRGVLTRHNTCGYEWESAPTNLLNGRGCPNCAGNMRKTHEQFEKEVFDLVGNEYTILGEYTNAKIKVKMRHNECGHIFEIQPSKFVGSEQTRCRPCSILKRAESRTRTTEEFAEDIYELYGDEYTILGEYKGFREELLIRHNVCGSEYMKSPANLIRRNCKVCASSGQMRTNEQFIEEIIDLVGNEYTPLQEYNGANEKIEKQHNKCGHIWEISPHKFINHGRRCPKCNAPKGELYIAKWLDDHNILYEHNKSFKDCKNIKPLPFDFKIFDENGELYGVIEFDGIQHFEALEIFGGQVEFEYRQVCDQIKNDYCLKNNILFLRIKYNAMDDLDEILEKFHKDPYSIETSTLSDYMFNDNCKLLLLV